MSLCRSFYGIRTGTGISTAGNPGATAAAMATYNNDLNEYYKIIKNLALVRETIIPSLPEYVIKTHSMFTCLSLWNAASFLPPSIILSHL